MRAIAHNFDEFLGDALHEGNHLPFFDKTDVSFGEVFGRLVEESDKLPSPRADLFVANAFVKVAAATVVANGSKERQGMKNPAVRADRIRFVFVEVNELARIEVDEKFTVKSEVGRSAGEQFDVFAPDLFVIGASNGGGNIEIEVVEFSGIIANPANATGVVVQEFGKSVDESVVPPRMFEQFGKSVFAVDGAVENLALSAINVTENGLIILPH